MQPMYSSAFLIVSNVTKIKLTLSAITSRIKNLYIYLNISNAKQNPPAWSTAIAKMYSDIFQANPELDVKILVSHLKASDSYNLSKRVEFFYSDARCSDVCELVRAKYNLSEEVVALSNDNSAPLLENDTSEGNSTLFDTVVLGGTFDRIHLAHKILLTEAVLRARKKLIIGVTDGDMIKNKRLWELILPVEERMASVWEFLRDIDCTLQYSVVPISDPFGPTQTDPDIDMIIVSAETLRGGHKVNEVREQRGLKKLQIHCIELIEWHNNDDEAKEKKISSSNIRMDLLGTRLRKPEVQPNLPATPYIIGLCGGVASGKTTITKQFSSFGAAVIDCDQVGHEVYQPGKSCYQSIIEHFGKDIVDGNSFIDRKKLGAIVFNNPEKLEKLNQLVWPEILVDVKKRIAALSEDKDIKVVFVEAAVLLRAGWDKECHEVWSMIISSEETIKRLKKRNNLSDEEARLRLKAQIDNKTVVERSHVVFSSEWSYDFTKKQAEKAWKMLMEELKSR